MHDRLRRDPRRLATVGVAAHAVGHEHDRRPPLAAQRKLLNVGKARRVDDDLGVHGAREEVVLVLGALFPGMGQPKEVDLVVSDTLTLIRVRGEHLGDFHRLPLPAFSVLRDSTSVSGSS